MSGTVHTYCTRYGIKYGTVSTVTVYWLLTAREVDALGAQKPEWEVF